MKKTIVNQGSEENYYEIRKQVLMKGNVTEGGKQLIRSQLKIWPHHCRKSRAVLCKRAVHGESPEIWTRL